MSGQDQMWASVRVTSLRPHKERGLGGSSGVSWEGLLGPPSMERPKGGMTQRIAVSHWGDRIQAASWWMRPGLSRGIRKLCVLSHFSRVQPFESLQTLAHEAPLSMGFSRQEHWSGLPCLPPGDLPNPGVEHLSLSLLLWQADSLPLALPLASKPPETACDLIWKEAFADEMS